MKFIKLLPALLVIVVCFLGCGEDTVDFSTADYPLTYKFSNIEIDKMHIYVMIDSVKYKELTDDNLLKRFKKELTDEEVYSDVNKNFTKGKIILLSDSIIHIEDHLNVSNIASSYKLKEKQISMPSIPYLFFLDNTNTKITAWYNGLLTKEVNKFPSYRFIYAADNNLDNNIKSFVKVWRFKAKDTFALEQYRVIYNLD